MTISYDSVRRLTDIVVTHFCVGAAPPVQSAVSECSGTSVDSDRGRWRRVADINRYQRHNEVVDKRTHVSVSI